MQIYNYLSRKNQIYLINFIAFFLILSGSAMASHNLRRSEVVVAVEKVSAAVVNISSEVDVYNKTNPFSSNRYNRNFDDFFKDFFEPRRGKSKKISLGSGVIIDGKRGYILTNAHVVEKTSHITVSLNDKREFDAQLVGADPESDLAVLRIKSKEHLPAINMGNSDDIMIGETIIAIGNPFGFSNTVSSGVVSAVNRSVNAGNRVFKNFIQIDAPINPGNSGGPLLNILGDLIGINTAIYASAQGIGFAIPINRAKKIVSNLIKYGEVVLPWTGIEVQDIDRNIADYLNLKATGGVVITQIEEKSPALQAGLKKWDVIISINKDSLENSLDFESVLKNHSAGDVLRIKIIRNGKPFTVDLATRVFPIENAENLGSNIFGITVTKKAKQKGLSISEISKASYLYRVGVRPGDSLCQINDSLIETREDYIKSIVKYRNNSSFVLLIVRKGYGYYITVER
jgi:Do/DeqQ family serine protease